MPQAYLVYLILGIASIAFLLSVFLLVRLNRIQRLLNQFFSGRDAASLEKIMLDLVKKSEKLDSDIEDLFSASNTINELSLKGLSRMGLVRFNPFSGKGHKDCFALALIDSKNTGVVISSLNTGGNSRIFVKKIVDGEPDIILTKEEQQALALANQQ